MALDFYTSYYSSEPETVDELITFTGNGTSQPSTTPSNGLINYVSPSLAATPLYYGKNIASLVRTGTGAFTLTFKDKVGNLVGTGYSFLQATGALSGLANYNVVFGPMDSTNTINTFVIYSGTTPTDLTTAQQLSLCYTFKRAQANI